MDRSLLQVPTPARNVAIPMDSKGKPTLGQILGFEDLEAELGGPEGDPGGAQQVGLNVLLVLGRLLLLQLWEQDNGKSHPWIQE